MHRSTKPAGLRSCHRVRPRKPSPCQLRHVPGLLRRPAEPSPGRAGKPGQASRVAQPHYLLTHWNALRAFFLQA